MQASIISLEFFNAFRYTIPGLDLMPSLCVQKNDSFGFVKYDILYNQVLCPLFTFSLKKHSLQTDLKLKPLIFFYNNSTALKQDQIRFILRAFPKIEPPKINQTNTTMGKTLMNSIRDSINIDTDKVFQIPDYIRRTN